MAAFEIFVWFYYTTTPSPHIHDSCLRLDFRCYVDRLVHVLNKVLIDMIFRFENWLKMLKIIKAFFSGMILKWICRT